MQSVILGVVRHVLTSAGGALVAKGVVTSATFDQGVGAAMTLVGIIWSAVDKKINPPS